MTAFKEYVGIDKPFVLHRTTGFGGQGEEPLLEHEIIGTADSYIEALELGAKLKPRDPSGWTYDSFAININLLTPAGQVEYKKYQDDYAAIEADRLANPTQWETVQMGEYTINFKKCLGLEDF